MLGLLFVYWNMNPEIFRIGGFAVRWYGVLFVSGFILGYWMFTKFCQKVLFRFLEGIPRIIPNLERRLGKPWRCYDACPLHDLVRPQIRLEISRRLHVAR